MQEEGTSDEEHLAALGEVSLSDLSESLDAYVACLEPKLDGYIRVDLENPVGVLSEYQMPDGSDNAEAVDSAIAECEKLTQRETMLNLYMSIDRPTTSSTDKIEMELEVCFDEAGIDSSSIEGDLVTAVGNGYDPEDLADRGEFRNCTEAALYGPKVDF